MRAYDPGHGLALNQRALSLLRDLINGYCGIYYEDEKLDLLADKVAGRVLELGLPSFEEYYHHLRYDPEGQTEWRPLMDVLTVHETYFMREAEQLRAFAECVAPSILAERRPPQLLVWSAACSTGEEPYSLAMLLLERGIEEGSRIVATDISGRALERARRGVYGPRSLRAMPPSLAARYLSPDASGWRVAPSVRDLVSFRQVNLLDEGAMRQFRGFDVVFCRNVFIYFASPSVQKVLAHFHAALNPGGYLFVGTAESLLRQATAFDLVEVGHAFAYRKR